MEIAAQLNRAAVSFFVIPAQAGTQANARDQQGLGSRLRGNDKSTGRVNPKSQPIHQPPDRPYRTDNHINAI